MKNTLGKCVFCILVASLLMVLFADNTTWSHSILSIAFAESSIPGGTEITSPPAAEGILMHSPIPSTEPIDFMHSSENDLITGDIAGNTTLPIWITTIIGFIADLSIEHITLLSVLVTLVIFVSGKQSEVKYRQLEARKEEYTKFIELLQKSLAGGLQLDQKTKKEFFDTGASLLLYGSKRVYKKYLFFREFTSNPLIVNSKYNIDQLGIYIIADLLKAIRHEVGLTNFSELTTNETLAFFVNNFGLNPISKIQSYRARYSIFMIKAELFAIDRTKLIFTKKIYYYAIKPLFGIISLFFKYAFMVPLGRTLTKLFPEWSATVVKEKKANKET